MGEGGEPAVEDTRMSWTTEAESGLRGLPDVEDARILVEGGEIREIHIISGARKPAKLIVKDVVGLLWTRFNRRIDHRVVGVVRVRPETNGAPRIEAAPEAPPSPPEDLSRIRFGSVNLFMDGARAQAQVELRWKGILRMGSASGWCSREGAHRLVAAAALSALQEYLEGDVAVGVEDVQILRVGRQEAVVVALALLTHRQEKILTGCCTVGRDLPQAVVLATLSALNRVVGGLRTKEPIEYILRPAST
jgi:hypothetical protein